MEQELTDDSPCPVNGIHFGKKLIYVPASYLDFIDQPWLPVKYPAMKRYIDKNRRAINQDLER